MKNSHEYYVAYAHLSKQSGTTRVTHERAARASATRAANTFCFVFEINLMKIACWGIFWFQRNAECK
jgi:hypothetical protein